MDCMDTALLVRTVKKYHSNKVMKRKVLILLTKFPDNGSKAIHLITNFQYTHASIGLDEDMNTFYSFVTKGFIVEKITRYIRPDWEALPCLLYELDVEEEVYQDIKERLNRFLENKKAMHYTRMGLLLCLLHIPCRIKNHYFCSQFVAEILHESKAVFLRKNSSLYLPKDFGRLQGVKVRFQGNLQSLITSFSILPSIAHIQGL